MMDEMQHKAQTPILIALLLLIAIAGTVAFASLEPAKESQNHAAAAQALVDHFEDVTIGGEAAIVIDIKNGRTLYEKNADAQLPLASLTKVALVLAVDEALSPDAIITIPYYASGAGGSGHLMKGEEWHVRDVIDFTLVASSNNGAEILAEAAEQALRERYPDSPPHAAALARMNAIARDLKLDQTYFLNVSGLDLSETQAGAYGSARDVARLFAYAAEAKASLFAGTARDNVQLTASNGLATNAVNTNNAQGAIPGLIMGKTGTTDLAGGNLAIVFDVGLMHPVVAVVLGSSESGRFTDMQKLVAATRRSVVE